MVASFKKREIMHKALAAINHEGVITDEHFKMTKRITSSIGEK